MRTVVRFLPSNVAKEIPEQNHQIPLKHIPFSIDDGILELIRTYSWLKTNNFSNV